MKNKYASFFVNAFFLVLIISTLVVGQTDIALADKPDTNSEDIKRQQMETMKIMEVMRAAHPYRPFAATWPNSEGILLDIQLDQGTTPYSYSIDDVSDGYRYFRSFITATINHLSSTLNGLSVKEKRGTGEPEVKVIFVRKVFREYEGDRAVAVPASLIPENKLSCRLDSPWVKLDIQRSPVLRIHAIFFWNERQFLIDQALLSGDSVTDLSTEPYDKTLFRQYSKDYVSQSRRPPENRKPGISERIPAELLWLFRRSTPYGLGIKFFSGDMLSVKQHMEKHYAKLTNRLVDQCFLPEHDALQRYKTILDLRDRDIAPLDKYQINLPIKDYFY